LKKKIGELIKKDKRLQLVEGELIASYYLDGIAEEMNEALEDAGELQIGELAKRFGLTSDFVQQLVEKRLGKQINGKLEKGVLYTNMFVERHTSKIRGIFSALTKPSSISNIITQHNLQETLFYTILEELIVSGQINGAIQGRTERAVFVPAVFSHARQQWIESFYSQNGFIEYNTLERLQFTKPRAFLESRFSDGLALNSCFISSSILKQVDAVIADTISSGTWIDILPFVPPSLTTSDIFLLLENCPSISQGKTKKGAIILADHFLASNDFLERCLKFYDQAMREKAQKGLLEPQTTATTKDTTNENTTTTKKGSSSSKKKDKSKKKGRDATQSVSEEHDKEEILSYLQKWFEDAPEEFLESLIPHLFSSFLHIKEEASRSVFVDNPETRQKNNSFEEDSNTIYSNIQLFQKAIEILPEEQLALEKHLLKTLCNDLVNYILANQAMHHCISVKEIKTPSDQSEVLTHLPSQVSTPLSKLIKTLTGKSVNDFILQLEVVADICQLRFKQLDKKSERQLLFTHRQMLLDQLAKETNPATSFHLVVVLLFAKKFSVVAHVPGRAISSILTKLKPAVPSDVFALLTEFQTLVIQFLTSSNPQIQSQLEMKMPALKELVLGKDNEK